MRNSLSEQLLRAGLVTEEQVKKSQEKPQRQNKPAAPKKKGKPNQAARGKQAPNKAKAKAKPQSAAPAEPELSAEERAAIKAQKQKLREFLRDHRLNKNQVDDEVKQALGKGAAPAAEGDEAPEPTPPPGPLADIKYHFQLAGRTHHLYVTAEHRQGLIAGQLSILLRNERYYLLSAEDSATVREMASESLFFTANVEDSGQADENDPYAAYQIPDDLHW